MKVITTNCSIELHTENYGDQLALLEYAKIIMHSHISEDEKIYKLEGMYRFVTEEGELNYDILAAGLRDGDIQEYAESIKELNIYFYDSTEERDGVVTPAFSYK